MSVGLRVWGLLGGCQRLMGFDFLYLLFCDLIFMGLRRDSMDGKEFF